MIQIDHVEIRYFRSIYKTQLQNLTDVVVLAGRNDIGKSNILKALNLFFNNEADWNTPFEFLRDFSRRRLAEVRETIKGRQFIGITIGFVRGDRYEKSLPKRFTVTRTWYRDRQQPDQRNSLQQQLLRNEVPAKSLDRAYASLQRYLNTIRFEYIPAVKDNLFFTYVLSRLQDVILDKPSGESGIADTIVQLNSVVEREALSLRDEFKIATGIETDIRLPKELGELFRAFAVATKSGNEDMPLNLRGDGIRSRFLPSLLNYISQHSTRHYIWGFEEPENSLEHALSTSLAQEVVKNYSQKAQVFITTHSPAFFGIKEDNVSVYRVLREEEGTIAQPIRTPNSSKNISLPPDISNALEQELGLMEFQERYQREYEARVATLEDQQKEVEILRAKLELENSPVLLTEGKWDVLILVEAWKRLYKSQTLPFRIISCDPLSGGTRSNGGGAGGVGTLKSYLETVRIDLPITVGLFDRDVEGQKTFDNLSANFEDMSGQIDVKIQKAGTAAAIILPVIRGREDYASSSNLT